MAMPVAEFVRRASAWTLQDNPAGLAMLQVLTSYARFPSVQARCTLIGVVNTYGDLYTRFEPDSAEVIWGEAGTFWRPSSPVLRLGGAREFGPRVAQFHWVPMLLLGETVKPTPGRFDWREDLRKFGRLSYFETEQGAASFLESFFLTHVSPAEMLATLAESEC